MTTLFVFWCHNVCLITKLNGFLSGTEKHLPNMPPSLSLNSSQALPSFPPSLPLGSRENSRETRNMKNPRTRTHTSFMLLDLMRPSANQWLVAGYVLSGLWRQNRGSVGSTVKRHHEHRTGWWSLVRMVYHYFRSNARLHAVATAI